MPEAGGTKQVEITINGGTAWIVVPGIVSFEAPEETWESELADGNATGAGGRFRIDFTSEDLADTNSWRTTLDAEVNDGPKSDNQLRRTLQDGASTEVFTDLSWVFVRDERVAAGSGNEVIRAVATCTFATRSQVFTKTIS